MKHLIDNQNKLQFLTCQSCQENEVTDTSGHVV